MKLDFTVWKDPKLPPDLYSDMDDQRYTNIVRSQDVLSIIDKAKLHVAPTDIVYLHFGRAGNGKHTSVVITSSRVYPGYPRVASGPYCDLMPVWRAYAAMLVSGGKICPTS